MREDAGLTRLRKVWSRITVAKLLVVAACSLWGCSEDRPAAKSNAGAEAREPKQGVAEQARQKDTPGQKGRGNTPPPAKKRPQEPTKRKTTPGKQDTPVPQVPAKTTEVSIVVGDNRRKSKKLRPGAWLRDISSGILLPYPFYTGAARLDFEWEGSRLYMRRDGGARHIAAVKPYEEGGMELLRAAYAQGDEPLLVYTRPSTDFSALPPIPPGRFVAFQVLSESGDLPFVKHLRQASALYIGFKGYGQDITPLRECKQLVSLAVHSAGKVSDLTPLASLHDLQTLEISAAAQVTDLRPLSSLRTLRAFELSWASNVRDLGPVRAMRRLVSLRLSHCESVTDLSPLAQLRHLTDLHIEHAPQLSDVSPLGQLSALEEVSLAGCSTLTDISGLAGCSNIRILNLTDCTSLEDLGAVSHMRKLRVLSLRNCASITDLSSLSELTQIELLSLYGCDNIEDVSPIRPLFHDRGAGERRPLLYADPPLRKAILNPR